MKKNQMDEVAKLLGVELNEEFEIDEYGTYVLTSQGLVARGGEGIQGVILTKLLTGELTAKHKPWKPKMGETFYCIDKVGRIHAYPFKDFVDIAFYKIGDCYQTPEDAEANIDKWVSFYASDTVLDV